MKVVMTLILILFAMSSMASTLENRRTGEKLHSTCIEFDSVNNCKKVEVTGKLNRGTKKREFDLVKYEPSDFRDHRDTFYRYDEPYWFIMLPSGVAIAIDNIPGIVVAIITTPITIPLGLAMDIGQVIIRTPSVLKDVRKTKLIQKLFNTKKDRHIKVANGMFDDIVTSLRLK